jgi:hypothetical protein
VKSINARAALISLFLVLLRLRHPTPTNITFTKLIMVLWLSRTRTASRKQNHKAAKPAEGEQSQEPGKPQSVIKWTSRRFTDAVQKQVD